MPNINVDSKKEVKQQNIPQGIISDNERYTAEVVWCLKIADNNISFNTS